MIKLALEIIKNTISNFDVSYTDDNMRHIRNQNIYLNCYFMRKNRKFSNPSQKPSLYIHIYIKKFVDQFKDIKEQRC